VCIIDNLVLTVLLLQEYIGKRVLDTLYADGIWLIRKGLEAWADGIKIGERIGNSRRKKALNCLVPQSS
jgi:hypothetical protein